MTNLNQLIEQRQGYGIKEFSIEFNDALNRDPELLSGARNLANEAYRQALEDVLAGLPEEDNAYERRKTCDCSLLPDPPFCRHTQGENDALQTVRAQIEELLGKIE